MTRAESAFHIHYICNRFESSKSWMDHTETRHRAGEAANMGKVKMTVLGKQAGGVRNANRLPECSQLVPRCPLKP